MSAGIEPHRPDEHGWIIAWRHKREFRAGRNTDEVMTYREAVRKAEELTENSEDTVYWAEALPES